jgi:hypothetical protein
VFDEKMGKGEVLSYYWGKGFVGARQLLYFGSWRLWALFSLRIFPWSMKMAFKGGFLT